MTTRQFHLRCTVNSPDLGDVLAYLQELNIEVLECSLVVEPAVKLQAVTGNRHPRQRDRLAGRSCRLFVRSYLEAIPPGSEIVRQDVLKAGLAKGYKFGTIAGAIKYVIIQGNGYAKVHPGLYRKLAAETTDGV